MSDILMYDDDDYEDMVMKDIIANMPHEISLGLFELKAHWVKGKDYSGAELWIGKRFICWYEKWGENQFYVFSDLTEQTKRINNDYIYSDIKSAKAACIEIAKQFIKGLICGNDNEFENDKSE